MPKRMRRKISLTMIVRDEEHNLPQCLSHLAGIFDEVIVVDTGSTDRTMAVAAGLGAKVIEFKWRDDFSAARNAACDKASGDYIFWLDADDRLSGPNRRKLSTLLDGIDADTAYVMQTRSRTWNDHVGTLATRHVRLYPNRAEVRWQGRLHEQILPSLLGRFEIRACDVIVDHTGYSSERVVAMKECRNLRLAEAELADDPNDPVALLKLGRILSSQGDASKGLEHLLACLAAAEVGWPVKREAYYYASVAHLRLGDAAAALDACQEGLSLDPDDLALIVQAGAAYFTLGDCGHAKAYWEKALAGGHATRLGHENVEICIAEAQKGLACLATDEGDFLTAYRLWSAVISACPRDRRARLLRRRVCRRLIGAQADTAANWLNLAATHVHKSAISILRGG